MARCGLVQNGKGDGLSLIMSALEVQEAITHDERIQPRIGAQKRSESR